MPSGSILLMNTLEVRLWLCKDETGECNLYNFFHRITRSGIIKQRSKKENGEAVCRFAV